MTIDYNQARELMVEQQIRPWDVLEMRVLNVLATLPREAFVAEANKALAYSDIELPLANGSHMLKPVIEGRLLQALDIRDGEEVLHIGTGSGFVAACLGQLAREVLSLEIDADQAAIARANLDAARLGDNVRIETADALAWDTERRFDAIAITGAMAQTPTAFLKWLRPGGRLFVVRGVAPAMEAVLIAADGSVTSLLETEISYLRGAAPTPQFTL
jgi:protein-L-isoaspartate(D-aspartate) O-methyltransferase